MTDTYTGDVKPGGPADVRELARLTITKVAVDEQMSNNAYLLRCTDTGDQVLIDAAAEPATLLPLVGDDGLTAVVTTHQHWDHHRALADVIGVTGAEVVAGEPDADAITEQTGVEVSRRVSDGDRVAVGDVRARGHPDHRPHTRLDLPALPRSRRAPAPLHRRLAVPRRRGQHVRRQRRLRQPDRRRARPSSSAPSPTTPGSTPATATTRRSAPSGRSSAEWRERGW